MSLQHSVKRGQQNNLTDLHMFVWMVDQHSYSPDLM